MKFSYHPNLETQNSEKSHEILCNFEIVYFDNITGSMQFYKQF